MKKLLVIVLTTVIAIVTNAQSEQTFKPFKMDISAGYALPATGLSGSNGGFLISFEPKYAISDFVSLGIKVETSITVSSNPSSDYDIKGTGSYLATGDYYFNTNTVRPFIGAGLGLYTHAATNVGSSEEIKASSRFGFAPRAGFEIAHFRAALEYNLAGKVEDFNRNYLGIKFGVLIGGGRIE